MIGKPVAIKVVNINAVKVYSKRDLSAFLHASPFLAVRLAAHVSKGLKSRIRPVVGRIFWNVQLIGR